MKDVKQDLFDRLLLLRSRYEVAFSCGSAVDDRWCELYAEIVEKGLHDSTESSLRAVRAIVDPAEMSAAAFWQTPLGALAFSAGGYPNAEMPQSLAALVLGCSRQYVSEMVKSGKLTAPHTGSRMVLAEGVRELLRRKLDKFVN